jgi:Flp pilus assembly protein TadG
VSAVPRRPRRDAGAAFVELALILPVLFAVLAILIPLGEAFIVKMHLGRVAGTAARFGSAAPNSPSYGSSGRRPTVDEIVQAAGDAYSEEGGTPADLNVQVTPGSKPGDVVVVTVSRPVGLGPLGSLLGALNLIASPTITVSATASDREE